jgi:hypothetical protein
VVLVRRSLGRRSMSAFLGIDPGAGGALALYVQAPKYDIVVLDMPVHEVNGKRRIDLHGIQRVVASWEMQFGITLAIVENVGAMPGQSPNGMFWFGYAACAAQSAVVAAGVPMKLVTPQTWKKHYGLAGGPENKDQARQLASRAFPSHAHLWARKKDDGRAEAVLMAAYGATL